MVNQDDPLKERKLQQLQLLIYLIPVLGFFPALVTLYRGRGSREQEKVSRLSVTLTLCWLLVYSLLWVGAAQTEEFLTLRLLFLNGLWTSGYFLLSIGLIIRLGMGKLPRLPLIKG